MSAARISRCTRALAEHGSQECIFSADELTIASAVDPKLKIEFESLSFTRAIVFLIVFAFLSFAGTVCCADPSLPVTFNNVRDGFSISFPSGWGPMAAAKLETANKTAAIEHPDWKRPAFHYGYEMTNSAGAAAVTFDNANTGGLAFAPYMAIRITETARPPRPKSHSGRT